MKETEYTSDIKGHEYKNINYPMAQRIINITNNTIGGGDAFFDTAEESLLSMFIFYFKEVKMKKSITEVLLGINNILKNINNIEDFHNLFIDIKDEYLKCIYTKSYFYGIYTDFSKRSFGMTKEEASRKNGWLLNSFNITLVKLKDRFKRNDIEYLIKVEEVNNSAINKASKIVCRELDLDELDKSELESLLTLFNKIIDNKLINDRDFNLLYLAKGIVERVLSQKHSNFISKVQTLFKSQLNK